MTKTIVFCIPGPSFSYRFLRCWTNLVFWCLQNDINPVLSNDIDSNVYFVRSKILGGSTLRGKNQKPFNGSIDYDYIMFIDSDIIFSPEDIKVLLDMDKDIACGAYLMNGGTHYAIVENFDNDYFLNNGSFEFLSRENLKEKKDIFEVEYCGMGFMLIKKNIIEQLPYPWFYAKNFIFNNDIEEFTSEDVTFCMSLTKKGYKININPNVRVGHEKMIVYIDK
tara:strand:- start:398 stop:1063 length:666 start_codon:yes stop_codon:yes gene_type:complete